MKDMKEAAQRFITTKFDPNTVLELIKDSIKIVRPL